MSMLTAAELACMRATETMLLDGTCTLDGVSVACYIKPMAAETVVQFAERLGAESGWVITLPYGTACVPGDTITAGAFEYDVLGTNEGETNATAVRAYCGRRR